MAESSGKLAQKLEARWREAQEAELAFWRTWRSVPTFKEFDVTAQWEHRFKVLGLTPERVREHTVVEVGCGPLGSIFYLPPCKLKVGLDPLAGKFADQSGAFGTADPRSVRVLRAVGERLPLRDACADIVICYNVIDHVMDPGAVLDEIRRILKPNAPLFLMSHTFPAPLCPFLGFDKPHPHHWSLARLLAIVRAHNFEIDEHSQESIGFKISWRTFVDPRAWKHLAAELLVASTYISARRVGAAG